MNPPATLAPKMSRESSRIDWRHSAEQIARQIRGLYPWPGCRVRIVDLEQNEVARLTLVRGPSRQIRLQPPAQRNHRAIQPSSAAMRWRLKSSKSSPEGKCPMPLPALFATATPWEPGMRLESIA